MVSLEMRGFYALTDDVIDAMVNETSPSNYCLNGGAFQIFCLDADVNHRLHGWVRNPYSMQTVCAFHPRHVRSSTAPAAALRAIRYLTVGEAAWTAGTRTLHPATGPLRWRSSTTSVRTITTSGVPTASTTGAIPCRLLAVVGDAWWTTNR